MDFSNWVTKSAIHDIREGQRRLRGQRLAIFFWVTKGLGVSSLLVGALSVLAGFDGKPTFFALGAAAFAISWAVLQLLAAFREDKLPVWLDAWLKPDRIRLDRLD
jgi:hypothetical protein